MPDNITQVTRVSVPTDEREQDTTESTPVDPNAKASGRFTVNGESATFEREGVTVAGRSDNGASYFSQDVSRVRVTDHVNETDLGNLEGVKPFRDHDERAEAFADPRYKTSASYRRKVNQRLMASGE